MDKSVAEKYTLTGIEPGKYDFPGYGVLDLRTLTVAQADALAARKFPWLKLIPEKPKQDKK